ncbi:MAG: CHAT domain-containing tetratricopeptide repeat protein [Bacteroidota bacterium]
MIKKTPLFLLSLVINLMLFSVESKGQQQSDTDKFKLLIEEGISLMSYARFEESKYSFLKARDLADSISDRDLYFKAERKLIELLWRQTGKQEESIEKAKQVLHQLYQEERAGTHFEASVLVEIANANLLMGKYDSSKYFYTNAIATYKRADGYNRHDLAVAYANFGVLCGKMGDIRNETRNFKISYEIMKTLYAEDDPKMVPTLNNMASTFANRNLLQESAAYLEESVRVLEKNNKKGSLYNTVISNLGILLSNSGETKKGFQYLMQGLKNQLSLYGKGHIESAGFYIRLAENLEKQELYDSSRVYLKKAYQFLDELKNNNPELASSLLFCLIRVERGSENYDEAISRGIEAIKVLEAINSPSNYNLILAYYELGKTYLESNQLDEAAIYLHVAIDICMEYYGPQDQTLKTIYQMLSVLHRKRNQFDRSLRYIQQAIEVNHPGWQSEDIYDTPGIETAIFKPSYLNYLSEKAEVLLAQYRQNKNRKDLETVLILHNLMDNAIRMIRKTYFLLDDKRGFQEVTASIYESAIAANFLAFRDFDDSKYLGKCFYFSEASKTGILSDALNTMSAKRWSGLPHELLELERSGKADGARFRALQFEEKAKSDKDSIAIAHYDSLIFTNNKLLDSITTVFENDYPAYHEMLYKDEVAKVSDVNQLLDNETGLISYFLADTVSYAFYISGSGFEVRLLPPKKVLAKKARDFRTGLNLFQNQKKMNTADDFFIDSHRLYQMLIAPFEDLITDDGIRHLEIIPDADLGYIPFETLLKSPAEDAVNELAYLIEDFNISYGYSSLHLRSKPYEYVESLRYLSFAPSYQVPDKARSNNDRQYKNAIVPLYWNSEEAALPGLFMTGESVVGNHATEKSFKAQARRASVLHMAMHAFVDDADPMNSSLVFYQDKDSIEDGYLHTFELYNMQLDAELAVLSACETGYGKIVKGEGIVSLARGFAYAGVPSVVMSHWQVDDRSTSLLMEKFYQQLSEGKSKSEALRVAKIAYLKEAKGIMRHPFYWGAFVVIGDNSPIAEKGLQRNYYVFLLGVLLFIMVLMLYREKLS